MEHETPISPWNEWTIVEKIGEGSYGKVYKAQRTEQGRSFFSAIKVIPIPASRGELTVIRHETNSEDSAREYFQNVVEECIQEISTMEFFRGNSHIVSVEDFKVMEYLDEIGWDIYIRMEFLQSFLDYCMGKTMTEWRVIRLGIDICKALEYCGKLRIIHRDIKPENIFVSRFGDFKLGDFGIARELERSMGGMSKKGTFSYMAPEMYQGKPYDSSVDIYSLGIVLYKLMNRNRLPFMDLDKQLITYRDKEIALNKRMEGELLPPPKDASQELSEIILRACAYDVRERYQDPEMMRVDLERLRRGEYIAGSPAKAVGRHRESGGDSPFPFQDKESEAARKAYQEEISKKPQESGPSKEEASLQAGPISVSSEGTMNELLLNQEALWKSLEQSTDVENDFATPEQSLDGWQEAEKKGVTLPIWGVVAIAAAALFCGMFGYFITQNLIEGKGFQKNAVFTFLDWEGKNSSAQIEKLLLEARVILGSVDMLVEEGKQGEVLKYYDGEGLRLALIYPDYSISGKFEEYFYQNKRLFLAYIWNNSLEELLFYNSKGDLIRWVDQEGKIQDGPSDDPSYVALGDIYWDEASKQLE